MFRKSRQFPPVFICLMLVTLLINVADTLVTIIGFGGTFAVGEEAVSCVMGLDRLADHQQAGAEVITAVDMSCLMHLDGLARRDG